MVELPSSGDSLLVRTDFEDDAAWLELRAAVEEPDVNGFTANVEAVDHPKWEGVDWADLQRAVLAAEQHAAVLFVVDAAALDDEDYPIIVVDLLDDGHEPFRCTAGALWSVDNNLNLANMDWDDFADSLDSDGVFRGFE